MTETKKDLVLKILRSPLTLFISMGLGIAISQLAKPLLPVMDIIATIYMSLLQMCVIPIVVCAVTVNIGNLLKSGSKNTLFKWILLFAITLSATSILAVIISSLSSGFLQPDPEVLTQMQEASGLQGEDAIKMIEYYGDHSNVVVQTNPLLDFVYTIFPENIFTALTGGEMLPIIFFFILLGIMLTNISEEKSAPVYKAFDGIYGAMNKLMDYILLPFPIAIMALLAQQFASPNVFTLIGSLVPLVAIVLAVVVIMCIITWMIVKFSADVTAKEQIEAVKRTFFVAIGTSSAMATVSVALEDVCNHLKIKPQLGKTVLPISISMCQPGVVASVAVAAVYGMVIYGIEFSITNLILVAVTSVIFSLAVIGVPGLVAVSMLTIVLDPLYIPSALIIAIYLTIIPIINPPVVFAGVYANFGILSILNKGDTSNEKKH